MRWLLLVLLVTGCVTPRPEEVVVDTCSTQRFSEWFAETEVKNPTIQIHQQRFDGEEAENLLAHYNNVEPKSTYAAEDLEFTIVYTRGKPGVVLVISSDGCIMTMQMLMIQQVMGMTLAPPETGTGI
jgi:hypothetical protein